MGLFEELKSAEKKSNSTIDVGIIADQMWKAVEHTCRENNDKGIHNMSGYLKYYLDDGYTEECICPNLPTYSDM